MCFLCLLFITMSWGGDNLAVSDPGAGSYWEFLYMCVFMPKMCNPGEKEVTCGLLAWSGGSQPARAGDNMSRNSAGRSELSQPSERGLELGLRSKKNIKHSRMAEGWQGRLWVGMHMQLEEET